MAPTAQVRAGSHTVRSPGLQPQVGREVGSTRASPRTMSLQLHSWDSASTYQCNLWLWGPPRCRERITNSMSAVNHPISTLRGQQSWLGSTRQLLKHRRRVCGKTQSPRTQGGHGAGTEWTRSELGGTAGPSSKHTHRIHTHPSCLLRGRLQGLREMPKGSTKTCQ